MTWWQASLRHTSDKPYRRSTHTNFHKSKTRTSLEHIKFANNTYVHQEIQEIGRQIQDMKASGSEITIINVPSFHDVTQYKLISTASLIVICIGLAITWHRLRRCRMQRLCNISASRTGASPTSAMYVRPAARAKYALQPAGRPPARTASGLQHPTEHDTTFGNVSDR